MPQTVHFYWTTATQLGGTRYSYDALGTLTGAVYADGQADVRQPDAVGNLFRTAERADRHYDQGGQLRQAGSTRYRYDAEGNLVRKTLPGGQVWHYGWDGAGQLVEVKRPDGYAVTFGYDGLGRRVSKRFRGKVTHWVWDGDVPLHEWAELEVGPGAGSVADLTTWLFEEESFAPTAKLTARGAQSVVNDHLGTPLAMYDGQGRQTWEMTLDSYGAVRQGRGRAQDCPFRYQGQYEDVETGLYYNRFRYYDPEAGQYISQDPIRTGGGLCIYAYVKSTNITTDAYGLSCDANFIAEQLERSKRASVTVKSREEAEMLLRELTSGNNHPGGYMNTTEKGIFNTQHSENPSDWLPRPSSNRRGTYHYNEYNPNAKLGDHAREASHIQIHTFDEKIIRIYYP